MEQNREVEEKQEEKYIRMTTQPPEKLILKLAFPTIISMLITTFYNLADTFFVGKLNQTSATGAVGVAFSLMAIIQAVGFFFGHGSGNFISRELGKKNMAEAERMASVGFFSAFFTGCIIMVFSLVFLEPLARFLGSTETILPYAMDYISYILIGVPFMCASLVLNNQLRFQGNAFFAMIGLCSGAILNIGLDPLLIFVLDMGVSGAALATIISQIVSFILLFIGVQRSDSLKIHLRNFRPSAHFYANIVKGGLPSLARQGLGSVATVCLNATAGNYSDAVVAAVSIVSRIMMFASSALIGFGQGFQPVCGFNYGAKLYKRVKSAFIFCVKYATLFLVLMDVLLFFLSPNLIALFQKGDPEVIRVGTQGLRYQLIAFPLSAWVVMSNMMTQTIGKAVKASFLAMMRQGLALIPAVLILNGAFGLTGLLIAQPVADLVSFLVAVPMQRSELKELDVLALNMESAQKENRENGENR